jgi:glycerol uptake facilitator-like aquaporin
MLVNLNIKGYTVQNFPTSQNLSIANFPDPAVTVGMVLIGAITILHGTLLFIFQIVASIVAAALVSALF